jgi:DNA-binding NarL/FixJ family response regulator
MSIRVLVADDQELVRTGLRMILDAQPGIEVISRPPACSRGRTSRTPWPSW